MPRQPRELENRFLFNPSRSTEIAIQLPLLNFPREFAERNAYPNHSSYHGQSLVPLTLRDQTLTYWFKSLYLIIYVVCKG